MAAIAKSMFPKDGSWELIVSHRAEDAIWGYVDPGKKIYIIYIIYIYIIYIILKNFSIEKAQKFWSSAYRIFWLLFGPKRNRLERIRSF